MAFKPGKGLAQLHADLKKGKQAGLLELKMQLEQRVSEPGPPSEPGEYPAKQTGVFAGSFFVEDGRLVNSDETAAFLEFKPPSEGGRPAMTMAAADETVQAAVAAAVVKGVRRG